MRSNECMLSGDRTDINKALEEVEKVAAYNDLSRKEALQLRLLAEEMMGMQAGVLGFVKGKFYLENKEKTYNLYLHTEIDANTQLKERDKLVAMSTDGKNAAYAGFMGKIRKMMDYISGGSMDECYSGYYPNIMEVSMSFMAPFVNYDRIWELGIYREKAKKRLEEWDELEKSIVASICDDLVVGVRSNYADLIAVKKFK